MACLKKWIKERERERETAILFLGTNAFGVVWWIESVNCGPSPFFPIYEMQNMGPLQTTHEHCDKVHIFL